jgi:hypothetical protein
MNSKVARQRKRSPKRKRADLDQETREKVRLSPDEVTEDEKNLRAWAATEKLLKSGINVKDALGRLDRGNKVLGRPMKKTPKDFTVENLVEVEVTQEEYDAEAARWSRNSV